MRQKQINRILAALLILSMIGVPAIGFAQSTPSADQIYKRLAAPTNKSRPTRPRVSVGALIADPLRRRQLPSIDIHTINFAFGSANIPSSERWKVGNIASAIKRFSRRRRGEVFLLEGHTDAVGSNAANLALSRRRSISLKRNLVRYFGVRPYVLETAGYGEYDLLVRTQHPEWRNRRVTIRRISDAVYR